MVLELGASQKAKVKVWARTATVLGMSAARLTQGVVGTILFSGGYLVGGFPQFLVKPVALGEGGAETEGLWQQASPQNEYPEVKRESVGSALS